MKRMTLLLLLLLTIGTSAQSHKKHRRATEFDFTGRIGLNFSQIDGDGSGSYNHIGPHLGVNTTFPIGEGGFRLLTEVGLSTKGSTIPSLSRQINLFYFELPILLSYRILNDQLQLSGGVAPAFLGKARVTDAGSYNQEMSNNYIRMDYLPLCFDAQYLISQHMGLGFRYYNSMLNVGKENGAGTYRIFRSNFGQFNRLVSASLIYRF